MGEQLDFYFDENNIKFTFYIGLYKKRSVIYKNSQSKRIEINHFAFICTNCTRVQINLLHLKRRSKFAPGCKLAPGCKFLKHRSHGKKYTRGANVHPGANCAYEPSLKHHLDI